MESGVATVAGCTAPPVASTRRSVGAVTVEKRMVPSGPHAAVDSPSAGVIACGVPPRASTRFIWPSAKNPIERLSGDQNGQRARSVPGSGRASAESSVRTQSVGWP